jgi:hypothetical protein
LAQCGETSAVTSCDGNDDLGVNAAHSVTIRAGGGGGAYSLTSTTGPLTIGGGGLRIVSPSNRSRTRIGIPIVLGVDEEWTFDKGIATFDGGVSATSALTADLSAGASLELSANFDVGDLNLIGVSGRGPRATVVLNGVDLNGSGTFPVALTGVELRGYGHVGPLTASGSTLVIGRGYVRGAHGPGVLTSGGDVSLDSTTKVTFDDLGSATAGGDGYPQFVAAGNVTLGSATLQLDTACASSVGDVFTIVNGRSVSGTFSRPGGRAIANGDVIAATALSGRCTDFFKVAYTPNSVTATQVPPA